MAVQTAEQLKTAFGVGKFPNVINWEDLIDTIFSRGGGSRTQIKNIELNAYSNPWNNYTINNEWIWGPNNDDNNIGGVRSIGSLNFINSNITSPYSPILASDFKILFDRREESKDYFYGKLTENEFKAHNHEYVGSNGDVILVHNDGAFYNEQPVTEHGEIYIQWVADGGGEYWKWYADDARYYEWNQSSVAKKPQIIQLPVGCTVALAKTNGGWQPIGNFIAYDYDTLMQKVQDNPYNY